MPERWICLKCNKTFDEEITYHYPPKGYKDKYPNLPKSDPGCFGKVVKITPK